MSFRDPLINPMNLELGIHLGVTGLANMMCLQAAYGDSARLIRLQNGRITS
jgi:hypothetical protein